jgi:hypothetical protein
MLFTGMVQRQVAGLMFLGTDTDMKGWLVAAWSYGHQYAD